MSIYSPGKQDYSTPKELIHNIERRFGLIKFDLAANENNHVVDDYYGPNSIYSHSMYDTIWPTRGLNWLNPPYTDLKKTSLKCRSELLRKVKIALLIPAYVSTQWFSENVHDKSYILFLTPRVKFEGIITELHMMLCIYGLKPGYECWNWKDTTKTYNFLPWLF